MKNILASLFIFVISGLLLSCVSQNRFKRISERVSQAETDKTVAEEKLKTCNNERERLLDQNTKYANDNEKLRKDTTERGDYQRKMIRNFAILNESYEKLLKNQDRIQAYSNDELSKREKDLQIAEKKVNELIADVKQREEKLKSLEEIIASKDLAVNQLKQTVAKAMNSFKAQDLTVTQKDGKVYVSLSEQLLFKSGSTEVNPKGIEPLRKLATTIKDRKDLYIFVEGHTDDVKITKGSNGVKDNWDLSVLRATSVTKILTDAGVSPTKVIPSGRGEFIPLEFGQTADAREKNRRTEIILSPNLDELMNILENK